MSSAIEVYDKIDERTFKIVVTDNIEFTDSEEGTKLNFNRKGFTVTEDVNVGEIFQGKMQIPPVKPDSIEVFSYV